MPQWRDILRFSPMVPGSNVGILCSQGKKDSNLRYPEAPEPLTRLAIPLLNLVRLLGSSVLPKLFALTSATAADGRLLQAALLRAMR